MEKSFDKILDPKYKVDLDSIYEALSHLGYEIGKSMNGIKATKYVNDYRFHIDITLLPTGQIDRYCCINLHKDMGVDLFHRVIASDKDIEYEYDLFNDMLSNIIKRKNHKNDMDICQKDINKMLRDINALEKHIDDNQDRRIFINKFREDLNLLFEIAKDDEEDFRRSLVVLLLDIVDQINVCELKGRELAIIKDITKSLLNPVSKKKLDYYTSLMIEKDAHSR